MNELPIRTKNEKAKRTDFLVRVGDNKATNIELNVRSGDSSIVKGLSYVFYIYSSFTKKGDQYNKDVEISQINIDYNSIKMDKPVSKYCLMEEENHKILTNSISIYFLNLELNSKFPNP
jgi:hypothetical protein